MTPVYLLHILTLSSKPFDLFDYWGRIGTETVAMVVLLWVLALLQVFWWQLLIKAIYRVLFVGSQLKDDRSDSDASDREDNHTRKNK